jgi:hypothetical protein
VWGVVREVKKPAIVLVAGDEVRRFSVERVGQEADFVERASSAKDRVLDIVKGFVVPHMSGPDNRAIGPSAVKVGG